MTLKNYFLIIGFAVVVFLSGGCQPKSSKNKAKTETKKEQKQEKPKKVAPTIIKDSLGNVIERHANSYRKKDGSLRSTDNYYYTYDKNNNVIHEVKESYDPDGKLLYKNVNDYTYNDKNQNIELRFESFDSTNTVQRKARHTYKYNSDGYKIEDLGYFDNGSVMSKIILDPDETGALRSEEYIYYNEDGSKKSDKKFYYSATGLEKTVDLMKGK